VLVCTKCGRENGDSAKFCQECGAPLGRAHGSTEQRKTVTVLFCDVTGSTALGESTDPEALRDLLARYFERMKGIVEAHGGTVEKFIGDAVMAVFGVPQVHEDDALRACRAAVEMRDALPELGLQARIGLNTGEVVTGTEERLATGDAVNVAARLEQTAQPGEILIGEDTLALVREMVDTEPVEPLELRGKAQPIRAHRLVAVHDAPERAHEHPFVGRERELELLAQVWQRVLKGSRAELVTVVGDAGVGKSRLTLEFVSGIDAPAVRGRCLSYGEGLTYWPVVEVLKQLDALPSDPAAATALRSLLGESDTGTSADEIAWAFRKLLEERTPLVCIFDDMQWGEETFLDLIEHVALLSSAPILLLCLGRPDFAERRPEWPVSFRLEPLADDDVEALIPASLPDELRSRIAHAAGGNPLFLTEMAVIAEQTPEDVLVPPDLQALLAARLDQLDEPERAVLERGAVEGETFHRGSVQALSDGGTVVPRLAALVRKELIRPDQAYVPGDDGFRFRHLLIRDAAYDALPKATRAELHERFAAWLEERGAGLVELDEILGFHLEQASRYKAELGENDRELAERAGGRLAAAGRRALWRGDLRAASRLLERALELLRPIRLDVVLELDLSLAVVDPRQAAAIAAAAADRAQVENDEPREALARAVALGLRMNFAADTAVDEVERFARAAVSPLEEAGDHGALMHAWRAVGNVANLRGRYEEWAHAQEQALREAHLAGYETTSQLGFPVALIVGPRPADEALGTLESITPEIPYPGLVLMRAWLLAMLRRFEEAWSIAPEACERVRERTGYAGEWILGEIATLHGDHAIAARFRRLECEFDEQFGHRGRLATFAPQLGRSFCSLGRYGEAEPLANQGRELADEHDVVGQALWRQVQALVHAHRGEHAEAEPLAREAVAITERTDGLNLQADAFGDLAEVLAAASRTAEAADALEQALDRYERKKNLAMVAQVRPRLAELRAGAL
jgi:class 3 adenylate cyclase/tetratricopeptide (TPR) repeat protein